MNIQSHYSTGNFLNEKTTCGTITVPRCKTASGNPGCGGCTNRPGVGADHFASSTGEYPEQDMTGLYNKLHQVLFRYIKTRVEVQADAEDILQNTFIKVATKLEAGMRPEKLHNWIFTIARNTIYDFYRRNSKAPQILYEEDSAYGLSHETYNEISNGLNCCLMEFLLALPNEYRDILIDVDVKHIKQKALVQKYALAYSSIRSRVQRGREKLKQVLLQCCHIEWDKRGNLLEVQHRNTKG